MNVRTAVGKLAVHTVLGGVCWALGMVSAQAAHVVELPFLHYQEGFETGLPEGDISGEVTDVGWDAGNATEANSGIWHPGAGSFLSTTPLPAPADGNQVMFIDDSVADNIFVAVNTGVILLEEASYQIAAATGKELGLPLGDQSIQFWIDPNSDGTIDDREFVGQVFTTFMWDDAPDGEFVDNAVQFEITPGMTSITGTMAPVAGSELIILVTNFDASCCGAGTLGPAYWDNFRVTSDVPRACDVNGDNVCDNADVDMIPGPSSARTQWFIDAGFTSADFNLDGTVGASSDGAVLLSNLGKDGPFGHADGDADGDGLVTASADGSELLSQLAGDTAAVPEPSSLMLVVLAGLGLLVWRRRG